MKENLSHQQVKQLLRNELAHHDGGYDLEAYLRYNRDIFEKSDIKNVLAQVPGHNDGADWYWIIELNDGRFLLTWAGCDNTGWDCQSWGGSTVHYYPLEAAEAAPEFEYGRAIRFNLVGQIKGDIPYGLEES